MTALRYLVLSSRPLSWVNTAFPFAVGYFVVTQRFDWVLLVGSVFFLIPYNFLMYGVNDVFDYESDMRNPRKGGAEGGVVAPRITRAHPVAIGRVIDSFCRLPGVGGLLAVVACSRGELGRGNRLFGSPASIQRSSLP